MAIVMGTAGHIDHGKTTLVKRLTGVDCDRLEEEKRRGITIELGFASLALPEGRSLSIIDVPGHERFVRNMVAGATGIDIATLVIAADEGVMPQTREHIDICSILGIQFGLVVLTKIDMVDADLLALAIDDVTEFLSGTFLEGSPIFPVSAVTGEGMDALIAALARIEKSLAPERRTDLFRLPVDRVFTMRGHGTVVTGTMLSGSVSVGDEVVLYPSMLTSKVRGLQSHGESVEKAPAGRRTAVNLQGIEVDAIQKGEVLSHPHALFPSTSWIVEVTCLASSPRPLRHRAEVHFHHGSAERQARLYFFNAQPLQPGETTLAEVRFTEPLTGVFGDRFVVRSFSPLRTVGGGVVLHPLGSRMRRKDAETATRQQILTELAEMTRSPRNLTGSASVQPQATVAAGATLQSKPAGTAEQEETRCSALLRLAGNHGISFAALCVATNIDSRRLEKILNLLGGKQQALCFDKDERLYLGQESLVLLTESLLEFIAEYHRAHPMLPGFGRSAAASAWGKKLSPKLVHCIIERLLKQGKLEADKDMLRVAGFAVSLASDQSALRAALLKAHTEAGTAPPNMKDVLENLAVSTKEVAPLLKFMQESGELVHVAEGIWYAAGPLAQLEEGVRVWFKTHDDLNLGDLKEITGLSRKYLIALMEFFDKDRLTVRVGDKRILRNR